jgi:hypothetical protein
MDDSWAGGSRRGPGPFGRRLLLAFASVVLLSSPGCSKTGAVYLGHRSFEDAPRPFQTAEVAAAIDRAAEARRWEYRLLGEGLAFGTVSWGRHIARTLIAYDQAGFEIHYLGSSNLMARGGEIHGAYNRHVKAMELAILKELDLADE